MIIGLNLCPFADTRAGGVAYYAMSLLREFSRIIPDGFTVVYYPAGRKLLEKVTGFRQAKKIELNHEWEIHNRFEEFDVLFSPYYFPDAFSPHRPIVNYIPDIQDQYIPENFSPLILENRRRYYDHSINMSELLIVPSNFTKRTILEKFGQEEKIRVVPHGCSPIFADSSIPGLKPKGFPEGVENYLFYPSNLWKHKNHVGLLDALVILRADYGLKVNCILSGHIESKRSGYTDIFKEIRQRRLEDQVFHLGVVGLQELKFLYQNAACLVHPSFFEGFGIPLLEAMNSGCPIIGSDCTSIPEVARDAALYFNPNDYSDIASKIDYFFKHINEKSLRLIKGIEIAKHFSDRITAERTIDVLKTAVEIFASARSPKTKTVRSKADDKFLTMIFFGESSLDKHPIGDGSGSSHPESNYRRVFFEMLKDLNDRLQIMAVVVNTKRGSFSDLKMIRINGSDFRTDLNEMADKSTGRYLMFFNMNSLPFCETIYYLAALPAQTWSSQLLYGDALLTDEDFSLFSSSGTLPIDGLAVAENLSFIVLKEAFSKAVAECPVNIQTIDQFGLYLWKVCSAKNIYRTMNIVRIKDFRPEDVYFRKISKFIQHFSGSTLGGLFGSFPIQVVLRSGVRLFMRLPQTLRHKAFETAKTILSHRYVTGLLTFRNHR